MKRIVLFFMLILCSINVFAQNPIFPCVYYDRDTNKDILISITSSIYPTGVTFERPKGKWFIGGEYPNLYGSLSNISISYYGRGDLGSVSFNDNTTYFYCVFVNNSDPPQIDFYPLGVGKCTYKLFDQRGVCSS